MIPCASEKLVLIEHSAINFLLSKLADHGEEERNKHDLVLQRLQREKDEWNKRRAQKACVSIKKELLPLLGIPQGGGIGVLLKTKKERRKIFF